LLSKEDSDHSISLISEVNIPDQEAIIRTKLQMEEVKRKDEDVKDKLQRNLGKSKHTMGLNE